MSGIEIAIWTLIKAYESETFIFNHNQGRANKKEVIDVGKEERAKDQGKDGKNR
jgi:hypothetical protein